MNQPIRILHLEDEPDFSELGRSLLKDGGIEAEFVIASTREGFEAAMLAQEFDVILADYLLPGFNGLEALRWVRSYDTEIPFLIVSGTIGEEAAIESLKNGATDYEIG